MPLNIHPTSVDMLAMLLLNPVSALSMTWNRLEDSWRELNVAQGTVTSVLATAKLTDQDRGQLSYVLSVLNTQQLAIRTRQSEVSQAMNEVDSVKGLLTSYAPEMQRLIRDEQVNYERNHVLQEQLDEMKDEMKRRGIIL